MRSRLVILCEDKQQQTFVRRFLRQLGFEPHQLRFRELPAGKSAGEQFVRKRYPIEVKEYRQKVPTNAVGLLVIIDSDLRSLGERYKQLNNELTAKQMQPRQQNEHIPILIPKRNIETWIHFLRGKQVNEADAYPKLKVPSECWDAADELVSCYHGNPLPPNTPSSLQEGVEELKARLP